MYWEWLIQNKEWLLSGVAVAIPIAVFGWLFARQHSRRIQKQKAGENSTNIQVGGNINNIEVFESDGKTDTKGR